MSNEIHPKMRQKLADYRKRKGELVPPPDYPPALDYDKPVKEHTIKDFRTGKTHVFLLYYSRQRKDMYRVTYNGKLWNESIGYTHVLAAIRKAR